MIVLALALLLGPSLSQPVPPLNSMKMPNFDFFQQNFELFQAQFNKNYSPDEWAKRLKIFQENAAYVAMRNQQATTFKMGLNKFTDQTWGEFKKEHLIDFEKLGKSTKAPLLVSKRLLPVYSANEFAEIPQKVSWKNFASKVRDQQACRACYVFAALGVLETQFSAKKNSKINLSVQEIIDCDKNNNGCISGTSEKVFDYVQNEGLTLDKDYPFEKSSKQCRKQSKFRERPRFAYMPVEPGVLNLIHALREGPVVVLHVCNKDLKQYQNGVLDGRNCDAKINHAAMAVGYDLTHDPPFFEFKNAWGDEFGEGGYYKLAIGPLEETNLGVCKLAAHYWNLRIKLF